MTRFAGSWQLVPELSHYDQGGPPEFGRYLISTDAGMHKFRVIWRKDGRDFDIAFAAASDGSVTPCDFPGVDGFRLRQEDDALVSEALLEGQIVARALRRVSGDLMSVQQLNATPEGGWARIFQVYRRSV
jgi:hypothetical protein